MNRKLKRVKVFKLGEIYNSLSDEDEGKLLSGATTWLEIDDAELTSLLGAVRKANDYNYKNLRRNFKYVVVEDMGLDLDEIYDSAEKFIKAEEEKRKAFEARKMKEKAEKEAAAKARKEAKEKKALEKLQRQLEEKGFTLVKK